MSEPFLELGRKVRRRSSYSPEKALERALKGQGLGKGERGQEGVGRGSEREGQEEAGRK